VWVFFLVVKGRTAALRLIMQPYDEDEDDFCPFPSNGALVE
jgi:hypothetical protein